MTFSQLATVIVCLAGSVAAVVSERSRRPWGRILSKIVASSAFVILGLQRGAANSFYGRWLLAGLILCWIGDLLLLSFDKTYFLLGTSAFLLAHVAFIAAFASRPLNWSAFSIAVAMAVLIGAAVLNWLWPRLFGVFRVAIPAYIAVILTMVSLAVAMSSASGSVLAAAGALAFTASDISVARDRFVARTISNYGWGLPLYYLAMVLLAMSATSVS